MDFDGVAFGRRVAAARAWAGLVPKQLADQLGTSAESIYRLERGTRQRPPRKGELRLLSEALGQSEAWLLSGEAPPWNAETTEAPNDIAESLARLAAEMRAVDRKIDTSVIQRLDVIEGQLRELARQRQPI